MFKDRLMSSIVLVVITLVTVIMGGPILAVLSTVISIIGIKELYKIKGIENSIIGIIGYLVTIIYYILLYTKDNEYVAILSLFFLVLILAVYVFAFPKYQSDQVMLAFFGFFYVTIMLSYIYLTRMLPEGVFTVWLVFICSWVCDTCAYCVGVLFGKHKMAPILSPKKSIEGAIGGLVGAGLLGALYGFCIVTFAGGTISPFIYGIICVVGAMISMVGDLAASGIKRDNQVKDYGKLIPGHGGILDRFDSVIFTAPVVYYLAYYLMS